MLLAQARKKSAEIRTAVAEGRDPRAERRQPNLPTFRDAAEQYISDNAARWKNPKESVNWRGCLNTYAYPKFGNTRIDRVTRADVLNALKPVWTSKPSIARKLRQRIRQIFAAAMAFDYIDLNPAGEVIDAALPRTPAVAAHFRALPYQDVPDVLRRVEASQAGLASRLCFRFLVLTAARSGEARGARWDEIDRDARTWAIPGSRMKAGVEHRVPLSDAALEVLRRAKALDDEFRVGVPLPVQAGARAVRHDLDQAATGPWPCGPRHCPRISHQLQDVVHGDDRHPLGRGRGGVGSHLGEQHRASLRPLRPVRAAPRAYGTVVQLPVAIT